MPFVDSCAQRSTRSTLIHARVQANVHFKIDQGLISNLGMRWLLFGFFMATVNAIWVVRIGDDQPIPDGAMPMGGVWYAIQNTSSLEAYKVKYSEHDEEF